MNQPSQQLVEVEDTVQRAMKPVAAPPAFRSHLRNGLLMAAQHQQTHRALDWTPPTRKNSSWLWLAGAVMLGSLLGFIAIQFYARNTRRKMR